MNILASSSYMHIIYQLNKRNRKIKREREEGKIIEFPLRKNYKNLFD
jgi:hypothetical protein